MRTIYLTMSVGVSLFAMSACSPGTDANTIAVPNASTKFDLSKEIETSPGEWLTTGLNYAETRHSGLTQINTETVKDLSLAWHYDLDTNRGQEATPLYNDGILYTTRASSKAR